jgi:pimeloyl-ACP methyl ester carboxylesterase
VIHAIDRGAGAPALVLLHGVGGDAEVWRPQIDHFARHRRVVAWTMPAFGNGEDVATGWADLVAALARLLDAKGLDRVHLLGHSLGGMIAQKFAAAHPDRVAGLILSGTSPSFGDPQGEWQRAWVAERLAPLARGLTPADLADDMVARMTGPNPPDPAGRRLAVARLAAIDANTYARAIRLTATFEGRSALAGFGALPTLCLAGEHDANAPAAMMERMAARIPGARFVVLAGRGHLANLEDPAAFNAAVDDFLAHSVLWEPTACPTA